MRYGLPIAVAICFLLSAGPGFAQNKEINETWDTVFVKDLDAISDPGKTDGLGYTLTEEEALDNAIKKALVENEAPACECTKLAVAKNFNPYDVLMGVFKSKKGIKLDELCLCATETGDSSVFSEEGYENVQIDKAVMKQAADDAVEKGLLTRDEVTQAQCLETGLAFTETFEPMERNDPGDTDPDYSP